MRPKYKIFFVSALLLSVFSLSLGIYIFRFRQASHAAQAYGNLGQPMWSGVSSLLFGTNDTEEWSADNLDSDPHHIMIDDLARAHFGLVRSFFFHYTFYGNGNDHRTTIGTHPASTKNFTLAEYANPVPRPNQLPGDYYEIERRVSTIEKIGATCLGVLPDILTDPSHPNDGIASHNYRDPVTDKLETDLQFDEEVVAYLGNRCNLYEFGNEPDYNGISEPTYVQKWDEFIPLLKKLNPRAKFIGPVTASADGMTGNYMQEFLQDIAAGKVKPLPDAISFHDYPCGGVNASTESECLASGVDSYISAINHVRSMMEHYLGHTLPLGITEWNADPGSNTFMQNSSFMTKFTQASLQAMIDEKLDFAAEFDAQSYSGYCNLDMFDSCSGTDQPKAQFTEIAKSISRYYQG